MGLNDFLVQIPAQLILMTCGSGILLMVLWSVIIWRRNQRRTKIAETQGLVPPATKSHPEAMSGSPDVKAQASDSLRKIGQSVRNFFFYTDEEKEGRETGKVKNDTAPAKAAPTMTFSAQSQPSDLMEAVEVLRVWRDTADGSLIIQIGTARYRTLDEIRAAGQNRRFFAVMRDMEALAHETRVNGEEIHVTSPVETTRRPAPAPAAETPAPTKAAPPQEAPPPAPPIENIVPPARPSPVKSNGDASAYKPVYTNTAPAMDAEPIGSFFDNVKRAVRERGKEKGAAPAMASIPDQIEAYLQYKLSLTPPYLGRSIHVRAAPDGGVRIEVDGVFYESVDDITDTDVRDFVRGAIREWQEKQ